MSNAVMNAPEGLSETEKVQVERDGFFLKKNFYSAAEVEHILEVFMEAGKHGPVPGLSEAKNILTPDDPLAFYPRMMHPHKHTDKAVGKVARDFLLDKRLEPLLKDLMDDEPLAAQTMFYFKPPGARGQALHQDNFFLRVKPGTCMAAWLALDVTDEANGAMMVVPGSHNDEVVCPEEADLSQSFSANFVPVPDNKEAVYVNMQPGDILFFNGSVIHGSLPNKTNDRFRRSLIAHYVPAACDEVSTWYRPLLTFDGEDVSKAFVDDGGPCGVTVTAAH